MKSGFIAAIALATALSPLAVAVAASRVRNAARIGASSRKTDANLRKIAATPAATA